MLISRKNGDSITINTKATLRENNSIICCYSLSIGDPSFLRTLRVSFRITQCTSLRGPFDRACAERSRSAQEPDDRSNLGSEIAAHLVLAKTSRGCFQCHHYESLRGGDRRSNLGSEIAAHLVLAKTPRV